MVDFLTTVIALCFFDGVFVEANPIQAQLFSLGLYGWIISFFLTFSILFFMTLIIGIAGKYILKSEKREKKVGYYNAYLMFVTGIFVGMEIIVILNNVLLLLGMI
jgi:magnesium-transporting ATPase (P-type)